VREYQRKMEDMQLNFAQMLKETLDKVTLCHFNILILHWSAVFFN